MAAEPPGSYRADETGLSERVAAALRHAAELGVGLPADIGGFFSQEAATFGQRLRVALVGRVGSGKSTLANALLREHVVPTGVQELTYNVNWLRYAAQSAGLTVHFKDGRDPQQRLLAELNALTVRDPDSSRVLDQVDYLAVDHPNPYLTAFDLIDTPGLDSVYQSDSLNTLHFIGSEHAARAQALVLVFGRGASGAEWEMLDTFHHAGLDPITVHPITAIGALTMVEHYWHPSRPDPMVAARRVAARLEEAGGSRRRLYRIQPVASLVGQGAAMLNERDFADLRELARVEPGALAVAVARGGHFSSHDYPGTRLGRVPASRRALLLEKLSGYGLVTACALLREGIPDRLALSTLLDERSGMAEFRRILVEHFGQRAELVKLERLIARTRALQAERRAAVTARERYLLDEASVEITRFEYEESGFTQLAVLRAYYDGALELTADEGEDLLRVAGEYGPSLHHRLALPAAATPTELARRADERLRYWAAIDLDRNRDATTARAAQVVRRAYDGIVRTFDDGDPPADVNSTRPAAAHRFGVLALWKRRQKGPET